MRSQVEQLISDRLQELFQSDTLYDLAPSLGDLHA